MSLAPIFDKHSARKIGKIGKKEEEERRVKLAVDYFGGGFVPLNRAEGRLNPPRNQLPLRWDRVEEDFQQVLHCIFFYNFFSCPKDSCTAGGGLIQGQVITNLISKEGLLSQVLQPCFRMMLGITQEFYMHSGQSQ